MIDFNTEPYYDDYSEEKNFYRILFRPSYAVQARELTQLQTILQNQITRNGNHIFKQGAMVIPGQVSTDTKLNYVKLTSSYASVNTETYIGGLVGITVVGTSGLRATIVKVEHFDGTDPTTIFVRYLNSANDTTTRVFADSEVITTEDSATVYTFQAAASAATGLGSSATVQRGVYYVNGHYVLAADLTTGQEQIIILDKYSNTPAYRVGLQIVESIITPDEDESLLDNAQASYNFAAPGAHRYHIDLILTKLALDSVDDVNFIDLLQIKPMTINSETVSVIQRIVTKSEYSELDKTFARRTYDESGNYDVRPFTVDIREARTNDRGTWASGLVVLIGDIVVYLGNTYVAKNSATTLNNVPPTHTTGTAWDGSGSTGVNWEYTETPIFNRGIDLAGSDDQLALVVDPGKAYVQGYEIEKVSAEVVLIDKCRDASHVVQVDNANIPQTVGNYVLVNNVHSCPKVDIFDTVDLYNQLTASAGTPSGTKVGTARVRAMEWHNQTIGTTATEYKLMVFDVKMLAGYDFQQNVKSIYYNNAAGGAVKDFTADILPVTQLLSGTVTAAASTTVTGVGTSFQTDLVVGDYVYLGTSIRRVVTVPTQNSITVDTSVTVTGELVKRITTEIKEPNNEALIFPFPYYAIKSARAADTTNQITYSVYERFTGTTSTDAAGYCTLVVTTSSGTMGSAAETDNYIVIDDTTGNIVLPFSIVPSGNTATITFFNTPTDYSVRAFIVIGSVSKTLSSATEKAKTLNNTAIAYTAKADVINPVLSLGVADGYRIISIKQATGFAFGSSPASTDYTEDVSDRYDFIDGQTISYYGLSNVTLKASYSPPNAPVRIVFDYFSHGTGDYFTVNSYSTIDYKNIPFFKTIPLRDVLDFRPRMDNTGTAFNGSGGATSLVPKRGFDIQADFSFYQSRTDKLAVDFNGSFFIISGAPSLTPGEPADPPIGMVLYTISLEPYTFGATPLSVKLLKYENKRYTMRDIGKLEKRINNLEYYTSLTLLEQDTQSLDIIDSTTGMSRFKNGFIVDNFSGHSVGDITSPDYFCSVDMENNELRPFFSMHNINLIEKNSDLSARNSSNYKLWGDVITLPLDVTTPHVELVKQPFASRIENINPFAIFTFLGQVSINPSSDEWFEVSRRPDIIQNVEGNFNTITMLAEKAGVLGTVWNAWQTQWTGVPVSSGLQYFTGGNNWANQRAINSGYTYISDISARFGYAGGGGPARQVVAATTSTTMGQSRTGINTKVVAKIDTRLVNDKVLSVAVIPYMRSRNVLIQVTGLKPNTKFYPFFDNQDVSAYCTPATKITFSEIVSFSTKDNVGGAATVASRRINNDTQVCLNTGDVITSSGTGNGATAIVVGSERVFNNVGVETSRSIYIVNIIGTFAVGNTITGDVSGSVAIIDTIATPAVVGDSIVTNFNGEAQLLFNIPNTDSVRFRTGTREFSLTDSSINASDFTTRGRGNYSATGTLENRQATFIATRNADIVKEAISENRTIVQTTERVVSDTGWYDPLAQTFLVKQHGGAFLTKVDLFFATKDPSIPVSIEIREVVNGFPGKLILPFSKITMKPEDVNISANLVDMPDGTQAHSYDTATTFNFASPVYVQDNTEYALVVVSDSNGYKVWISNMGDKIPNSSRMISEQPYAGVLFKSQNGSTWTANQEQDLKFTLYRAMFNTAVVGTVQFVNDVIPHQILDKDPFETNTGFAKIKVYQQDHGFAASSKVTLSNEDYLKYGVTSAGTITCSTASTTVNGVSTTFETNLGTTTVGAGTVIYTAANVYVGVVASVTSQTVLVLVANAAVTLGSATSFKYIAPIHGIPVTEIYKEHTISAIVDNSSYIVTTTTVSTNVGYAGGTTVNATRNIVFEGVHPVVEVQTFSETSSNFSVKTTSGKSANGIETPYIVDSAYSGVVANENNYFIAPRLAASEENEASLMSGVKSVNLQCEMVSTNDSLSPVLDTHRMSLIAISNTVNSPAETTNNTVGIDQLGLITTNTTIGFTTHPLAAVMYSTDATVRGLFKTLLVGKYITITGATTSANNGTFLITKVVDDGTTGSITVYNNGATDATGASVTVVNKNCFIDEISPLGSSSLSKYVSKRITLENAATYLKIRLAVNVPAHANLQVYYKTSTVGTKEDWMAINYTEVASDNGLPYTEVGNNTFSDVEFSLDALTPFDAFAVKIVFTSTNSAEVARCKDLRIIACA